MSKHKEILKLFVANDNIGKDWANVPFLIDNKTYATNFHTMVIINKKVEGVLETTHNTENVLKVIPKEINKDLTIKCSDIKKCFENAPKKECYDVIGKDVDCLECLGEGQVEWNYKHHNKEHDCPDCDGSGYSETSYHKPNGKFELEDSLFIDIAGSRFSTRYISKLIDVADIINIDEFKLISNESSIKCSLFELGEVKVILMPVMQTDDNNNDVILTIQ